MNNRGKIALMEIMVLVIGIVAIGWALGSGVGVVLGFEIGDAVILPNGKVDRIKNIIQNDPLYGDFVNLEGGEYFFMNEIKKYNPSISVEDTPSSGDLPKETGSMVGDFFCGKDGCQSVGTLGTSNFIGHIVGGAGWAASVYGVVRMIGSFLPESAKPYSDGIAAGLAGGVFAGKATYGLIKEGGFFGKLGWKEIPGKYGPSGSPTGWSIGVGVVAAALIFNYMYKEESMEIISFQCNPWDAPLGGSKCEECNKQGVLPCSEYQCRSLGQSCQLLNQGTEEEKCAWVNKNDVKFPTIQPWEDALSPDYKYTPDNTISPPDRGVKILNKDSTTGCVKAFTPLSFGITLNEPGKCKIDYLRKNNFENMDFFFGASSLFKYNHSQIMSLPGPSASAQGNLTIENDGEFEMYVRCMDGNGNSNTATFLFKFCVEQGPDTTPPLIVSTNLLNGMPIAYNQTSLDLETYINEPADCRWSHLDKSYENMEQDMVCSSNVLEMNAQMLYKCTTTLTGLKSRQDNDFYFRCKDQPSKTEERNVNSESYEFKVVGTQPLVINTVGPNETVKDASSPVKVTLKAETSAGFDEGEATCYYSETGDENSYIMFFETNSYAHSQDLYLLESEYKYFIKCVDLGGNTEIKTTNFNVESDSSSPIVARVYHDASYLKLVTDEPANCVYDTTDCNYIFEEGISMTSVEETGHFTDWDIEKNFYIKCKDNYNNQPSPNQCNIIARPTEIYN